MDVQRAEAPRKALVVLAAEVLVAEYDDMVFEQRAMDFVELVVRQFARQVDAFDFGADDRRQRAYCDCLIRGRAVEYELADSFQTFAVHDRSPWYVFIDVASHTNAAATLFDISGHAFDSWGHAASFAIPRAADP